ncbi:general stress protein [Peribacillus deserti]|nr:general stress protein [Peribacillus deserti]
MNKRVIGVYENGHEAIQAVEKLQAEGYARDEISVIAKDPEDAREVTDETGTKAGEGAAASAATGGVLGGLTGFLAGVGALAIPGIGPILAAGPVAATLAGAATGAGAGGITGALIGMGIPDEEAERYETDIKEGKILVLVDADKGVHGGTHGLSTDASMTTGTSGLGRDTSFAGSDRGNSMAGGSAGLDRDVSAGLDRDASAGRSVDLDTGDSYTVRSTGVENDSSLRSHTAPLNRESDLDQSMNVDNEGFRDRTNRIDDDEMNQRLGHLEETRDPLITGDPVVDSARRPEDSLNPYDTKNGIVTDIGAGQEGKPFRKDNDSSDPIV